MKTHAYERGGGTSMTMYSQVETKIVFLEWASYLGSKFFIGFMKLSFIQSYVSVSCSQAKFRV